MSTHILAVIILAAAAAACSPAPPPLRPVADVKQLMHSVLDPTADEFWDGVGTIIDQSGTTEIKPETTADWDTLVKDAYVIAESGNLLMLGTRPKDGGEWMRMSRALVDVGARAIKAAESHDTQAVFDVGGEIYDVCTSCHAKYVIDAPPPPSRPSP